MKKAHLVRSPCDCSAVIEWEMKVRLTEEQEISVFPCPTQFCLLLVRCEVWLWVSFALPDTVTSVLRMNCPQFMQTIVASQVKIELGKPRGDYCGRGETVALEMAEMLYNWLNCCLQHQYVVWVPSRSLICSTSDSASCEYPWESSGGQFK